MNSDFAFLFPGQGSQTLGMGADLVDEHSEARAVFECGREILGFDVLEICRHGPVEELNSTRVSQPAIFLHSMAVLEVMRVRGILGEHEGPEESGPEARGDTSFGAKATAGLSLGEYSALVFAGALGFEDALRLVGKRGEYMQEACDKEKGKMASILGLPPEQVEAVVEEAKGDGLGIGIANYNSPAQTVISGTEAGVDATSDRLRSKGARRVVELRVAGAYHSPLMAHATRKMEPLLEGVDISSPRIPFYANYSGLQVSHPEEIRRGLLLQIENPVRWVQCMEAMVRQGMGRGMDRALEIGPGRVLQGLAKNINRSVKVTSIGTVEALDNSEVLAL